MGVRELNTSPKSTRSERRENDAAVPPYAGLRQGDCDGGGLSGNPDKRRTIRTGHGYAGFGSEQVPNPRRRLTKRGVRKLLVPRFFEHFAIVSLERR